MEILQDQTNLPHRVYAVEVTCQGAFPVTGYLYIPRGAETRGKKYPICVGYSEHGIEVPSCESGKINPKFREFIFFHVNAHGVKLREFGGDEQSAELHKWLVARDEVLAFNQNENYSKNLSYFSGMALRVMRAQDYVKTLPEWNGIDLWVEGSSQGGLQAIWAAALDSTVTRLTTRMTWGCDWGGQTVGRLQGSLKPKWTTTLGYFDAVNHAKRIRKRCSVEITKAGLGDMMCPPSGLAILWNNLSCPKKIVWVQGATHEYSPIAFKEMYEVIWEKK